MNTSFTQFCIYCGHKKLYKVSSTQVKCSSCMKKYSIKKLLMEFKIFNLFCEDMSVKECSETLQINYKTVQERYEIIRKLIIHFLENRYYKNNSTFSEYDEYYYLPQIKRGKVKYLFEAIGILGMVYEDKIYTLMLPDQFSHLEATNNETNIAYLNEYAKYLNRYKIIHYQKFDNLLIKFWVYLEKQTNRFKGINRENFIYYLKELEFKFNYPKEEQKSIVWDLWIKNLF